MWQRHQNNIASKTEVYTKAIIFFTGAHNTSCDVAWEVLNNILPILWVCVKKKV